MAQKALLIKRGVLPISHVDNACVLGYNVGMITNGLPAPLNITLVGGREKVVEMQVSEPNGAFRDMSYYTFSGKAEGVDGKEYAIEAWVDGGSPDVVLMRFPALPDGRYKWAITAEAEDGTACALVSGTLGVQWPQIKSMEGAVASPNRRVVVRYPEDSKAGVARWVSTSWLDAAVETALDAEKGAREAAEELLVVNDKLAQAEALKQAFDGKISEFVQPNEATGTWVVGGKDTGKPYKGADGADGQKIKRVIWDNDATLPSTGDGGTLLYVRNATTYLSMTVDSPIYLYVRKAEDRPDFCGLKINGIEVLTGGFAPLPVWVDVLNNGFDFAVKAELISMRWMKLTAVYDGVQLSVPGGSFEEMYFQPYLGYAVYGWVEGKGWVNLESQLELEQLPLAREGVVGAVKIVSSVEGADDTKGELPRGAAIARYVRDKISNLATKAEIEPLATKDELENYATLAEIETLASEEYVDQAVAEVSETTYSKSESDEQFVSKADAEELYIRKDAGYPPVQVITRKEFDALPVRDPSVIYYIVKEK